jgi:hypothetical protein
MEIKPKGNNGFINNFNDIIGLRPEREMTTMKTNTLRIRNEANLTTYGNLHCHRCKSVIAIEIQKTFSSVTDAAEYFGVTIYTICNVLKGKQKAVTMWERDENGNKIRKLGTCHLTYAAHAESAVDKLMECGRKANETITKLQNENATLRNELSKANAVIYGLRNENEALRKENEKIAELERKAALWATYEEHQAAKRKAMEDIENYKRIEQEAIALRQESEKKLAELMKGDAYVA